MNVHRDLQNCGCWPQVLPFVLMHLVSHLIQIQIQIQVYWFVAKRLKYKINIKHK